MAVLAIAGNFDAVAFRLEIETQSLSQMRFVLDDQHAAHALCSRAFSRARLRGSSRTTVVPLPSP